MPDITMCKSTDCQMRKTCYRNPESGTKADDLRQSWFVQPPNTEGVWYTNPNMSHCDYFWPKMVQS